MNVNTRNERRSMIKIQPLTTRDMPKVPRAQSNKQPFWCIACSPLKAEQQQAGFTVLDVRHQLIMSLIKCSNTSEEVDIDFHKCLDKYAASKWLRTGCVPMRKGKFNLPLVHWVCILGKYRVLEYLVTEKGFDLSVKVGRNKEGPLYSMARHLGRGLNARSSSEYARNIFSNVLDVFIKCTPGALGEKDAKSHDTIFHFLARRCNIDPCSRLYLKILLVRIKECENISLENKEKILSAENRKGNTFLHLLVSDESSANTVTYFCENFGVTAQRMSKTYNKFHKTPRQIAVERRCLAMLRALGAPDAVFISLSRGLITRKEE